MTVKHYRTTKIVFFGTPTVAADTLRQLSKTDFKIVAVITEPDKPAGRGLKLQESAVKQLAKELGIACYQPVNNTELQSIIGSIEAELGIIIAYGQIVPQTVIKHFAYGILNIHGSLLPQYRGAAPVQRAIWDGLTVTGVSIQQIDSGLDTGPILAQAKVKITPTDNTLTLLSKIGSVGTDLLIRSLPDYLAKSLTPKPQTGLPSLAPKLTKTDGLINWNRPDIEIERQIRACNPWPKAYTFWKNKRLIIHSAQLESGKLRPIRVQPEGKSIMDWTAWLNGQHLTSTQALDQIRTS